MNTIDITGLDPADVLRVLYNASRPQGLGPMTRAQAVLILAEQQKFDYLFGRVLKIDLRPLALHGGLFVGLYDRDNGNGAAQRAIDALRVVLRQ